MALVVQKFGGTSVADLERIRAVAARIKRAREAGDSVAVVVSAMAGATNQLVDWVSEIGGPHHDRAEYDVVVASGEQVTVGLLALALHALGLPARSFLGWQAPVRDRWHPRPGAHRADRSRSGCAPASSAARSRCWPGSRAWPPTSG